MSRRFALLGLAGVLAVVAACTAHSASHSQSAPVTSSASLPASSGIRGSSGAAATPGPSGTAAGGSDAPAALSSRPSGLIAVQEYQPPDARVFTPEVYANPSIAGVALRLQWSDLEPSDGGFDWHVIDGVFAQAQTSGKYVVLILVPGFGTPAWALQGVATADFPRQYGPGAGQTGTLPLPWDGVYLNRWFAAMRAVAGRYAANPAFRMIAAAGPTSVSAEMSLPNRPADIARWQALGYTPDRYVAAWTSVFDAYARIFPRQYFSLALYPGLPLGAGGRRDPAQRLTVPQRVTSAGLVHSALFALQTSGLTAARDTSGLYDLVQSNSGLINTGFQLTTSATRNPAQMGDASSPVHALELSLDRGIAAHVDFLQVYEADVVNPDMQATLASTRGRLP